MFLSLIVFNQCYLLLVNSCVSSAKWTNCIFVMQYVMDEEKIANLLQIPLYYDLEIYVSSRQEKVRLILPLVIIIMLWFWLHVCGSRVHVINVIIYSHSLVELNDPAFWKWFSWVKSCKNVSQVNSKTVFYTVYHLCDSFVILHWAISTYQEFLQVYLESDFLFSP